MKPKPFDRTTTGTKVAAAFGDRIRGKHILITGASPNSIGEATARAVAGRSPGLLILASRSAAKLSAVAGQIGEQHPHVTVRTVVVDLADQNSVREAATQIRGLTTRLDVLVNNAGVSLSRKQWSPDGNGIELTFATNHVGPFLLTNLLLPILLEAARTNKPGDTRIVNVSSSAHVISPFRFSDYNFEGKPLPQREQPRKNLPDHLYEQHDGFPGMVAYGASKTANILFSVALNERLLPSGIRSYAVNPGDILSGLLREVGAEFRKVTGAMPPETWKTPDQGSATSLVAAFDPSLSDTGG
ncbi:Uu.00g081800.m01.CDS01 [Anthostomella pinea]|uniref:Uu.00g081800.m01.CDS01 n=1 Tax=Anthostomella pinea TaxID=933095 RepID=A0AAI8VLA1_9PEZI|nr:Uu.00g081800.m01.CDS01 [Anthostomella pinea]